MSKDKPKSNPPEETLPEECRNAREILKHGEIWETVENTRSAMQHLEDCPACKSNTDISLADAVKRIRLKFGVDDSQSIYIAKRERSKKGKV